MFYYLLIIKVFTCLLKKREKGVERKNLLMAMSPWWFSANLTYSANRRGVCPGKKHLLYFEKRSILSV